MDLREMGERRVAAWEHLRGLADRDMPEDVGERMRQDARYRQAHDAAIRAEDDYRRALRSLTAEGWRDLARSLRADGRP